MPHSPEAFEAIVIEHAPAHIVNAADTVNLGPYLGSPPNDQELIPNEE